MTRRWLKLGAVAGSVIALAFALTLGLERVMAPRTETDTQATTPPEDATVPHISATLFLATAEGDALVPVRMDVPLASSVAEQGREIIAAQLTAAQLPFVTPIPPGASLRAFYVTERGEGFIDLSAEAATAHPGGSTAEVLTVYSLVNAVTANLPSVTRVQLLIDGKEVDTLAGHVDLRRTLEKNDEIVQALPSP